MKIALASDHRGYHSKERLKSFLADQNHKVVDCGTDSAASSDYPDSAISACLKVAEGETKRAILMCGSGIGMTITANKVAGIRAALCHDELTAEMSRRHNNANVLCLAADLLGDALIRRMVEVWLSAPFEGGRHTRRVRKMMEAERFLGSDEVGCPPPPKKRKKKGH